MSSLLSDLASGFETSVDVDDLSAMMLRADRTQLRAGEETMSLAKIGGQEVTVYTTLGDARLSRASLLFNERSATNRYFSLTTTVKPCTIEVAVDIDGQRMSLKDLLRAIVNGSKPPEKQVTEQQFNALLAARSYLQNSMVMVTQHNGLSESKATALFDLMIDNGASDVLETIDPSRRNNIRRVVDFGDEPGLKIVAMTLGSVDRNESIYGRGFENLVGAQIENFNRILTQHAVRLELEKKLAAERKDLDAEAIHDLQRKITFYRRAGSTWANNWGGVQEILRIPPGAEEGAVVERVPTGEYSAVNVPCGDFTVETKGESPEQVEVNLWTRKEVAQAELDGGKTYADVLADDKPF